MNSVRNWAASAAIAALLVLGPVIAFLIVIAAEIQVDLLMEAGTAADCAVAAGAIAWVLFRKLSPHLKVAAQPGRRQRSGKPALANPPT
jgi:hypothetical protein